MADPAAVALTRADNGAILSAWYDPRRAGRSPDELRVYRLPAEAAALKRRMRDLLAGTYTPETAGVRYRVRFSHPAGGVLAQRVRGTPRIFKLPDDLQALRDWIDALE